MVRFLKSKTAQKSVAGSADASAHIPSGQFVSGDNSRGASKASAEVIGYLNSCFDEFDSDDELQENIERAERRLNERARKYPNSGLPVGIGVEWQPSSSVLELVRIAIECSVNVYSSSTLVPNQNRLSFEKVKAILPSVDGVTKATAFFKVNNSIPGVKSPNIPALVVAIRGTKSMSDWLMNLNHAVRDARNFFNFADVSSFNQMESGKIEVHAGFLNGARALQSSITTEIHKYESTSIRHVLFTGHSGGGAVASLLFMHLLGIAKRDFPDFRFSLVTFGCPPITSQQLSPLVHQLIEKQTNPGVALAIINAHDPITKADGPYVKAMSDLYSQFGAAAPGQMQPGDEPWHFATQDLHPLGELIILKDTSPVDRKEIHGYKVEPRVFGQLIFCDRKMHKKARYLKNIKMLQGESED